MSVADTGEGMDEASAGEGHGAFFYDERNWSRHRTGPFHGSRFDGSVRWRHAHSLSQPGKGTVVSLWLPLRLRKGLRLRRPYSK